MPCTPMMKVRRDDLPGSGCHLRCLHRLLVEEYRHAREAWEHMRDDVAIGYRTEEREYAEAHPGPTFKQWLKDRARTACEDDMAAIA